LASVVVRLIVTQEVAKMAEKGRSKTSFIRSNFGRFL